MITLTISIEELEPGRIKIAMAGRGAASPLEFESGTRVRDAVSALMETMMVEQGNGIGRQINGETHGRKL